MQNTLLDKITIVIFSYNRHKCLKRTIRYWSDLDVKIVVIDGSDIKLENQYLNTKNIKYIYDPRSIHDRLLTSTNYIDTEFMMLSCDDEFFLPSALSDCISFLISNTNFSSCGGRAMGFGTIKQKILGFKFYPKLKDILLDDDSPSERIYKHFSSYTPAHIYSVIRSKNWKKICKHVFLKDYSFFANWELAIEFLVMVCGKSKIIPKLMWMRNLEEIPIRKINIPKIKNSIQSDSNKVLIQNWWYQKKFQKEKEDFLYRMKKASDEILVGQSFKFTEIEIDKFFQFFIKKNKSSKKILLRKKINIILQKIKKLIKIILFSNEIIQKKTLLEQASLLESQGVSVNYNDLENVVSALQCSKNEN